jgi:glycerol-3-phosphate dehydrogenase
MEEIKIMLSGQKLQFLRIYKKISQNELAKKLNIEAPVSNIIYEAVYTDISPDEVINKLMNRQLKGEDSYQFTHK